MNLSLVAEAAAAVGEAPRELLLGVLTGPELQQALEGAQRTGAPAPLVLHLFDAAPAASDFTEFTQRATVALAIAPSTLANPVPPPPAPSAPTAAATAPTASTAPAATSSPYAPDVAAALSGRAEPANLTPFEKRLFAAFCIADRDGSGFISKREFTAILARVRAAPPAHRPCVPRPRPPIAPIVLTRTRAPRARGGRSVSTRARGRSCRPSTRRTRTSRARSLGRSSARSAGR